jgi:hypothetical protein
MREKVLNTKDTKYTKVLELAFLGVLRALCV